MTDYNRILLDNTELPVELCKLCTEFVPYAKVSRSALHRYKNITYDERSITQLLGELPTAFAGYNKYLVVALYSKYHIYEIYVIDLDTWNGIKPTSYIKCTFIYDISCAKDVFYVYDDIFGIYSYHDYSTNGALLPIKITCVDQRLVKINNDFKEIVQQIRNNTYYSHRNDYNACILVNDKITCLITTNSIKIWEDDSLKHIFEFAKPFAFTYSDGGIRYVDFSYDDNIVTLIDACNYHIYIYNIA